MAELLLLRYESEEAERSPELRYLASGCRAAARRVFGPVDEIRWRPGAGEPVLARGLPILVFGAASVHLGAASLRRMKAAIDAGADGSATMTVTGTVEDINAALDAADLPGPKVVSVILDGENAWESYDNDGIDFLNALYSLLAESAFVRTVTPSELLAEYGDAPQPLPDIFPASWFQPNFATWIG